MPPFLSGSREEAWPGAWVGDRGGLFTGSPHYSLRGKISKLLALYPSAELSNVWRQGLGSSYVIPADAGIQDLQCILRGLDSCFHRSDRRFKSILYFAKRSKTLSGQFGYPCPLKRAHNEALGEWRASGSRPGNTRSTRCPVLFYIERPHLTKSLFASFFCFFTSGL